MMLSDYNQVQSDQTLCFLNKHASNSFVKFCNIEKNDG